MSSGGAQGIFIRAGSANPNAKILHYEAGTTNDKTVWTDEAKTTPAAQPFVADSNGNAYFFADGDYKFVINTSGDALIKTLDNFKVTSDTATMWEGNFGTSFPGATSANEMQMFAKRDATKTDLNLGINLDGTGFISIVEKKADGTFTIFDQTVLLQRVIDVKDFGATGDGSTDDATAIQNAINTVSATGDAIYFPRGIYKCTSDLTHSNDPITVFGDGMGISVLKFTSAATNGFDFNFDDATDNLNMHDLSIYTEKVGGGDAINATWPNVALSRANCSLENLDIGNTVATEATAYWNYGIVLNNSRNAVIDKIWFSGETTNGRLSSAAIYLTGATKGPKISNIYSFYTITSIWALNSTAEATIRDCFLEETTTGINFNLDTSQVHNKFLGCHISSDQNGITLFKNSRAHITDNSMIKDSASTGNYTGVRLESSSDFAIVTDNYIKNDASAGGTETGIHVVDADKCFLSNNIIKDVDSKGLWMDTNATNCRIGINHIDSAGTSYQDDGTGNLYLAKYEFGPTSVARPGTEITFPNYNEVFAVTGTGDIDTITASWTDRVIHLRSGDANLITWKDGTGNLRLNAAADKAFSSVNDTLSLVYTGSHWIQIGFSDNPA
jgi:hypothetical protein